MFKCPVEQICYTGSCPVHTCPANIKRTASGCIYQELKSVSKFSIGHHLKLTNPQIKKSYKKGVRTLTDAAKFYHLAMQSFTHPLNTCNCCGITSEKGDCINLIRCHKRSKFANKQITRLPMNALIKPTIVMFWITVSNPALQEFFSAKVVTKATKLLSRIST